MKNWFLEDSLHNMVTSLSPMYSSQKNGLHGHYPHGENALSGLLPLQQPVSSASPLPSSSDKTSSFSQVASPTYVHQYHALMDHQRAVFDEERALWHTERMELYRKISHLENSLRRYQAISSSQVTSPTESNGLEKGSFGDTNGNGRSRSSDMRDEFWKDFGGKSDARPVRTFSNSSTQSSTVGDRLPSIAEDIEMTKVESLSSLYSKTNGISRKSSIMELMSDKGLDGIIFKPYSQASSSSISLMTPQSPSPFRSPSPARSSPGKLTLPSQQARYDPYTKDAGHTPVARRSNFNLNGSAVTSDLTTPTQPERERPPLEPHASAVKVPSERSDSYFPLLADEAADGDHELTGPLGLSYSEQEDTSFLNELDNKLLQAAQSITKDSSDSTKPEEGDTSEEGQDDADDDADLDPEPVLRIKRSMNFGSQLGGRRAL